MDFALSANQESIRDAIGKICTRFDDAYWLKKDKEGGYPADFHRALADDGSDLRSLGRHVLGCSPLDDPADQTSATGIDAVSEVLRAGGNLGRQRIKALSWLEDDLFARREARG